MLRIVFFTILTGMLLSSCRGCTEMHDPRADWAKFSNESKHANKEQPTLTDEGKLPVVESAGEEQAEADPIDTKYSQFCASCHGESGDGKGPAGGAMTPKPRDFVTWNDPKATDEYIAKVIKEGGASVGLSPLMSAWGGMLSDDELAGMVAKVKAFKK